MIRTDITRNSRQDITINDRQNEDRKPTSTSQSTKSVRYTEDESSNADGVSIYQRSAKRLTGCLNSIVTFLGLGCCTSTASKQQTEKQRQDNTDLIDNQLNEPLITCDNSEPELLCATAEIEELRQDNNSMGLLYTESNLSSVNNNSITSISTSLENNESQTLVLTDEELRQDNNSMGLLYTESNLSSVNNNSITSISTSLENNESKTLVLTAEEFKQKLRENYFQQNIDTKTIIEVTDHLNLDFAADDFNGGILPKNINLKSSGIIQNNESIEDLVSNITAPSLKLKNLKSIKSVSGSITLNNGEFIAENCRELKHIPFIKGSDTIRLRQCPKLEAVGPSECKDSTGCPEDTVIADILAVDGSLKFRIPNIINNSLRVLDLKNINEIIIYNKIELLQARFNKCDLKEEIFEKIDVYGDLTLNDCELDRFPILKINAQLSLINCKFRKEELPDNLETKFLCVHGSLETLPRNLRVLGSMASFRDCNISIIPDDFYFQGELRLHSCHNITDLPLNWLRRIADSEEAEHHLITLEDMEQISDETIEHYNNMFAGKINIVRHEYATRIISRFSDHEEAIEFSDHEEAIEFWVEASADKNLKISLQNLNDEELITVNSFLHKLTESINYGVGRLKKDFANTVIRLVKLLASDDENIRNAAMNICIDGTETCTDRATLQLGGVDLLIEKIHAEKEFTNGKEDIYKEYIKKSLVFDEIVAIAVEHAKNRNSNEVIEFNLDYLIRLSPCFNLPFKIQHANYTEMAGITAANIKDAENKISDKITDAYVEEQMHQDDFYKKQQRLLSKWPDYHQLPEAEQQITYDASNETAILHVSVTEVEDLVFYNNNFYSYGSLYKCYIDQGFDPVNPSIDIDMDADKREIYRVKKPAIDSTKQI